jgi:hypothetical protein
MALLSFHCPLCHATLRTTNPDLAGRTFQCPKCSGRFPMPSDAERAALTARLKPAPVEPPTAGANRDEDLGELVTAKPRPRSRLLVASFVSAALVLLLGSGWVAYLAWEHLAGAVANTGSGNEQPLAYLPPDSTVLIRLRVDPDKSDPLVGGRFEQLVRDLGNSPVFYDTKTATGLEPGELFYELTYGVRLPPSYLEDGRRSPRVRRVPPEFTLVIRSLKPFSQKRVARAFPGARPQRLNERTYYQLSGEWNFHWLYMPSDRIIVLTRVADLSSLLQSDGTRSTFATELDPLMMDLSTSPFWVAFPLDPSMTDEARPRSIPGEWSGILDAGAVRAVALWARVNEGETSLHAGLVCGDHKGAKAALGAFAHYADDVRQNEVTARRDLRGFLHQRRLLDTACKLFTSNQCEARFSLAVVRLRTEPGVLADLIELVPREFGVTRRNGGALYEMMPGSVPPGAGPP